MTPFYSFSMYATAALVMISASADTCRQLSDLNGISDSFVSDFGFGMTGDGMYFCGSDAPTQFHCSCGTAGVCTTLRDPWGRNIGSCECCPAWVWAILGVFGVLFVIAVVVIVYACCLRDKWWFDGYPMPIQPILPRRGPPVVAPVGLPLPRDLFRGYRISDFIAGEVEQQQQLQQAQQTINQRSDEDEGHQSPNSDGHQAVAVGGTPTGSRRRSAVSFSRIQPNIVPITASHRVSLPNTRGGAGRASNPATATSPQSSLETPPDAPLPRPNDAAPQPPPAVSASAAAPHEVPQQETADGLSRSRNENESSNARQVASNFASVAQGPTPIMPADVDLGLL